MGFCLASDTPGFLQCDSRRCVLAFQEAPGPWSVGAGTGSYKYTCGRLLLWTTVFRKNEGPPSLITTVDGMQYLMGVIVMDTAQHKAPNYFGLDSVTQVYHFLCSLSMLGLSGRLTKGRDSLPVMYLSWLLDRIFRLDLMYLILLLPKIEQQSLNIKSQQNLQEASSSIS